MNYLLIIISGFTLINSISGLPHNYNPKIIGGTEALKGNYFVSIRVISEEEKRYGQGHICGGSLIHDGSAVLTAAHCLFYSIHGNILRYKPDEIVTVMGSNQLRDPKDAVNQQVTNIVIHENYTKTFTENQNDIAILWLNESVLSGNKNLGVINLIDRALKPDEVCTITGFGSGTVKKY